MIRTLTKLSLGLLVVTAWTGPLSADDPARELRSDDLAEQALALIDRLRGSLEDGYRTDIDNKRHLVYATALDQASHDRAVKIVELYHDYMRNRVFLRRGRWNIVILLPTVTDFARRVPYGKIAGIYDPRTRTLASITLSTTLIHELTHALHHGDEYALGQHHPIWIKEGLARLFQFSKPTADGNMEFLPPPELERLQALAGEGNLPSLASLTSMSQREFMAHPDVNYGTAQAAMLMLHKRELLERFYAGYTASYRDDPTGLVAYARTLGRPVEAIDGVLVEWLATQSLPSSARRRTNAYLGIRMEPDEAGVRVGRLIKGSPAAKAAVLQVGDVIIALQDQPVANGEELTSAIRRYRPGSTVRIELLRQGRTMVVQQVLGATFSRRITPPGQPASAPSEPSR